jgi:hypothetical protein
MSGVAEALVLAKDGHPVFPLRPGSKEPATAHGFRDASRDPKVIRDWWDRNPDYGVGVATGHGLAVLDVDTVEGHGTDGPAVLVTLEKEHGALPPTVEVRTPSGGRHLWFETLASLRVRSRQGLAPGLDLKASGGYVVAPPTHFNGAEYEWVRGCEEVNLAQLPKWIPAMAREKRTAESIPEVIHDGEGRERFLVSFAGTLRRCGLGEEAILEQLHVLNARQCVPPKSDSDLERIARSIAKYEASEADEVQRGSRVATELLDELRAAEEDDTIYEILNAAEPPTGRRARVELRGKLIKVLREKGIESPAAVADAWLSKPSTREEEDLQGQAFRPEKTPPWDSPVDGAELLLNIAKTINRYTETTSENLIATSLWVMHSHAIDLSGVSPILQITSATKRCGKTSMLMPILKLVKAGVPASNITTSSLFRLVESIHPTLVIDEAETFLKMADEFRGILNAGHTRDTAFVIRVEGDSHEPRRFSTWTPKVIAAIGSLPDTIEDRSIRLVLRRKPTHVHKGDAFDSDAVRDVCRPIQQRIVRWVFDNADALASAEPKRPEGLNDREWNNWKPLLAIAEVAGARWPEIASKAAVSLSGGDLDEDLPTLALRHLKGAFGDSERCSTDDLLKALAARDDGPWAKWWATEVAGGGTKGPASKLAKILKPFEIRSKQLRFRIPGRPRRPRCL